jgi:ferredoxin-NADP reductase/predicted pyridoxine 5'-phosphate oxidase superfamily flavin-nucleotide-binding protein
MSQTLSPFHDGERDAQARVGVREMAEQLGRQMVRDFMPDQHRQFYNQLPLLLVGSVDKKGRPWASVVVGEPGFATSPDPFTLRLGATPLPFDPLVEGLERGAELGLLGLEFSTRRRNRMNGTVTLVETDGFEIRVGQSFGNCPQYIQKRRLTWRETGAASLATGHRLNLEVKDLIRSADTFFIASTYDQQGTDVSHRGGKPGFVKVEDDETLVFPDFRGNNHFNTIGNLLVNPKAGLLFFNYQTGDVLYLTTRTEIVWDGPEVEAFQGAQRLVRFRVVEWRLVRGSFPFSWDLEELSPSLDHTGRWEASPLRDLIVTRVQQESRSIKSFYLAPAQGTLPDFQPGQHLPIFLPCNPEKEPLIRTYSLSQAPGKPEWRLTVKRQARGIGSNYLHGLKAGDTLLAKAPSGDFFLDSSSERPVVLLSAGVGITPMLSMLGYLATHAPQRQVHFIHGARNAGEHALRSEVDSLSGPRVKIHFRYSQPEAGDRCDSVGRLDMELLQSVLPFGNYDFYLCGPRDFLKLFYTGLKSTGVPVGQIRFETFGPMVDLEPVEEQKVEFRGSRKVVGWTGGSLLDLAEANGIAAPFSCRSGACGACSRRVISGKVEYFRSTSFQAAPDHALLCSARPGAAESGDEPLVIEL